MTTEHADLDRIAAWMQDRGSAPVPADLLIRARERALAHRSLPDRVGVMLRPAIGWAAGALALVAVLVAAAALRPTPPPTTVGSVEPPLVPLVLVTSRAGTLELVPGDPLTGRPAPDAVPIRAGQHHLTALSPDGRTMALLSWPNDDTSPGRVSLIDLATWTETPTGITLAPTASVPAWSADSTELRWLQATHASGQYSIPRGFQLMRWTVGDVAAAPSVTLAEDLMPESARVVGDELFVYGQPVDTDYLAADVPHLVRIDLATEAITADRPLSDVIAGSRSEAIGPDVTRPNEGPAVTWDLDRGRLLVASTERLSVVSLSGDLLVVSHTIAERRSFLDALFAAIVPAASAKEPSPGTVLSGLLAPAGDRLYLTGSTVTRTDGGWLRDPVGLLVVDPADGALLARLDAPVDQGVLSADGTRLLLTGGREYWPRDDVGQNRVTLEPAIVVDTDGLEVLARFPARVEDTARHTAGASWDGRTGYLLTATYTSWAYHLAVIDLETGTVAAEAADDLADAWTLGD